jgi:hypothetical protein
MIGYTLPEIRRLLVSLVHACVLDPGCVWSWSLIPVASTGIG